MQISIIIPAYNRAKLIPRAIESVLNQTWDDWELIIVDDGSTDDTKAVINQYLTDKRVSYYHQKNEGVCAARNHGAQKAKGEYLIFLDSDDEFMPDYLEQIHNLFHKEPDAIFAGVRFFEDEVLYKEVKSDEPYGKYDEVGLFLAGSFTIKTSLFFEAGMYDTNIKYGENTELSFRLQALLKKKIFLKDYFLNIYQEKGARTSSSNQNISTSTEYVLRKHQAFFNTDKHAKWIYLNVLAINYVKNRQIKEAKRSLAQAILTKPFRWKGYLRYTMVQIPFLRKKFYGV